MLPPRQSQGTSRSRRVSHHPPPHVRLLCPPLRCLRPNPPPPSQAGLAVEREVCGEARQAHAEPGTGRVWGKAGWVGTGS